MFRHGVVVGFSLGGLEGKHSVPRAELYALVALARATQGDIVVYCDCKYVVDRCLRLRGVGANSAHAGLWTELAVVLAKRPGRFHSPE